MEHFSNFKIFTVNPINFRHTSKLSFMHSIVPGADYDGNGAGWGKALEEVQRFSSRPLWKIRAYNVPFPTCAGSMLRNACTVHMHQCISEI